MRLNPKPLMMFIVATIILMANYPYTRLALSNTPGLWFDWKTADKIAGDLEERKVLIEEIEHYKQLQINTTNFINNSEQMRKEYKGKIFRFSMYSGIAGILVGFIFRGLLQVP